MNAMIDTKATNKNIGVINSCTILSHFTSQNVKNTFTHIERQKSNGCSSTQHHNNFISHFIFF